MFSAASFIHLPIALIGILCILAGTASAQESVAAPPSQQVPAVAIVASPQPAPAAAPRTVIPGIKLSTQSERATLGNNYYVIPDPNKSFNARSIAERVSTGDMADHLAQNSLVRMGTLAQTYWIVLPITNQSSSDVWELDFGGTLNGRQSFLNKLIVTNIFTDQVVYDSTLQGKNRYSIGRKIRLSLPVQKSGFIVLEARNPSGIPSLLNLSLRQVYAADTGASFSEALGTRIPLLATAILIAAFAIRRDYSFLALGAGWALIALQLYLIDHYVFFSGFSTQLMSPALWIVASLCLLAGFGLSHDMRREVPTSLFIGIGFLSLIPGLVSLLASDFMPEISAILAACPLLLVSLTYIGLSWPIAWRGINRTYFFLCLAGLLQVGGLALLLLGTFNLIPEQHQFASLSFFSYALTATAILTSLYAMLGYIPVYAGDTADSRDSDLSTANLDLAEAKEESEHKRLLQILEQERATMGEMQVQEARRTEEMRKAKEAADEANAAKSAFLAVVSHEIRTPMTGVMGMVRLMLDTSLSKEQKEYATTIQDSGEALMALLNDILDFEKIESGKLELESIDLDLHRLLRGVQTLMNGHAAAKNVELSLELDPKVPNFVVGDPTRLRQVLLNLVNNAIKFTAKGTVWLRVKDLTPDDQMNGPTRQLYFAVQDSGIGISAEVQKKLFMPFAQADATTARKYGGTGLGLAICKRLVESMGDMINISSKAGEGSTFFFTITMPVGEQIMSSTFTGAASGNSEAPASQPIPSKASAQPPQETQPVATGPAPSMVSLSQPSRFLNVLVVDDNGINQKVMRGLIEKHGHKVTVAGSGEETLNAHASTQFDIILLDIELPDMNGYEITKHIRSLPDKEKSGIPIVAMTGNTSDKDVKACLSAGMDDFLAKPIVPDRLKAVLVKAGSPTGWRDASVKSGTYIPVPPPQKTQATLPEDTSAFGFDFPDDTEEEDTFASAIRQFEDMEAKSLSTKSDITLDDAIIKSLRDTLSSEQLTELLVGFYEKTEELIASISQAWAQKDMEGLRARAHELKGMASNFGFSSVGALAAVIEKSARDGEEDKIPEPVGQLQEAYTLSKAHLNETQK